MWLNEFLRGWLDRSATVRRVRQAGPRRPGLRLNLEPLEERTLLSDFTAANVPELIAAIDAANLTPEADTIALVAGTTFTLTDVNNTTNGATGLPTIAAGEDLTIFGNGRVIERSTAAGTPAFRLFDVAAGASLTMENLTLQGGFALGGGVSAQGGAIHNQGTLTLTDVTVQNNSAYATQPGSAQGGAIHNQGTLTLTGVTVQNNSARGGTLFGGIGPSRGLSAAGGAIYSTGSLTLDACTIQNNQAVGGNGGSAGSASGGGLSVSGGTATLSRVVLVSNSALGGSGGPALGGRSTSGSTGGAGIGGGLYVSSATVSLADATISSNTAQGGTGGSGGRIGGSGGNGGAGFGGGLYAAGGAVTLSDSRVTDNVAKGGAGGSGRPRGSPGLGIGGGLYIEADALVCLDAFTESNVKRNKASTSDPNIAGPYTICS